MKLLLAAGLAGMTLIPLIAALMSPLLQWREPVYIIGGFAGVFGMALILLQPLLASGLMPAAAGARGRRLHRIIGVTLVLAILIHVGGLWITSPPDVIDALTFTSPTPFAPFGVLAMWAAFAAAGVALYRRRLGPRRSRPLHAGLVTLAVIGTVVHALLIEGTMEPISKALLAAACLLALAAALARMKPWVMLQNRR